MVWEGEGFRPETDAGEWLRGDKLSLHLMKEESCRGRGHQFETRFDPVSPSLRVWLFLVQYVLVPVWHSLDVKQGQKINKSCFSHKFEGIYYIKQICSKRLTTENQMEEKHRHVGILLKYPLD